MHIAQKARSEQLTTTIRPICSEICNSEAQMMLLQYRSCSIWGHTLPQATMREPHTAGVGAQPSAAICGSTFKARSTSPEYEAALMYVLYVCSFPCTGQVQFHQKSSSSSLRAWASMQHMRCSQHRFPMSYDAGQCCLCRVEPELNRISLIMRMI